MVDSEKAPPGWYADPGGDDGLLRWWDGGTWTTHTSRQPAQPSSPAAPGDATRDTTRSHTPPSVPSEAAQGGASRGKVSFFGARRVAEQLQHDLDAAHLALDRVGARELLEVQEFIVEENARLAALREQVADEQRRLAEVKTKVVEVQDAEMLQEVGIYEYTHPLDEAVAYKGALKALQDRYKTRARAGDAVTGATAWTVNGSESEGRRMVAQTCKLMLRAYNAEADNLVRGLKPYKLAAAIERLGKTRDTIERLGKTMSVAVTRDYHGLRLDELRLTADYLQKKAEEDERNREERERLREERKAEQELARERVRLEKEQAHYQNALAVLEAKGDDEGAERLRAELEEIARGIEDVDYRQANIRAGYVYVISNIGSFGPDVVKIGMTRRLEPMDRVRELGDASVPFRYDVHALHFSKDAVGIEAELHRRFAYARLNTVNNRREFFRVSPLNVRDHLLELAGDLLEFTEVPDAIEFRQSASMRPPVVGSPTPATSSPAVDDSQGGSEPLSDEDGS